MIDTAFKGIEPNGDFAGLLRIMPTGIDFQWSEEGKLQVSKGGSYHGEIDVTDPYALQNLYRYAGIDPSYWPETESNDDVDETYAEDE